jgi:hypothetical protein
MMIRQLEDDDNGDDNKDDEDVNTKKTYVTTEGCKKEKDSKHQHCKHNRLQVIKSRRNLQH